MIFLKLLRIHTLLLSAASIFMGVVFSLSDFPDFPIPFLKIFFLFFTAFGLQIISNIANDYGDGLRGVDKNHRIGFERMFATQQISKKQILFFLNFFVLLTIISGITLIFISWEKFSGFVLFWLLVGFICIFASLKYSLGKNPHSMSGWGDLSVFIFFGLVAVLGSYFFVYTKLPPSILFLESIAIGFLHASVLNLNNIRDFDTDKNSNRKTFAIRLGEQKAKIYQQCLVCSSFFLFLVASWFRIETAFQFLVFLLFIPLLWINFSLGVSKTKYNRYLKMQCLFIFLFSLCYASSFLRIE